MADNDGAILAPPPEVDAVNILDVEVPGMPGKKRRKRHHIDGILPPRPKRPVNAYSMFLKEYFRQRGGGATRTTMLEASQQWGTLDATRRAGYDAQCAGDRVRYATEMALWKQQKVFVKRPASAYALFLKDTWAAEKEAGTVGDLGVAGMGKLASERWKIMTPEDKGKYKSRYVDLVQEKRLRMIDLSAGNIVLTENGLEFQAPAPVVAPAAEVPPAVPGPDSDEEDGLEDDDF